MWVVVTVEQMDFSSAEKMEKKRASELADLKVVQKVDNLANKMAA